MGWISVMENNPLNPQTRLSYTGQLVQVDPNVTSTVNTVNTRLKVMRVKRVRVDPYKHHQSDTVSVTEMTILPSLCKSFWQERGGIIVILPHCLLSYFVIPR